MSLFRFLIHFILLFATPLASCSSLEALYMESKETAPSLLSLPTYDNILHLMEMLLSGELEKTCDEEALEKIAQFFTSLAREGILPGETEKALALERDIGELGQQTSYCLSSEEGYTLSHAVSLQERELLLCSHWWEDAWEKTKTFVKKHKEEIIIGAVVVVGVGLIATAAIFCAPAAAAGAALVAPSIAPSPQKETTHQSPSYPQFLQGALPFTSQEMRQWEGTVEEEVFSFKQAAAEAHFFKPPNHLSTDETLSLEDRGRTICSVFGTCTAEHLCKESPSYPQKYVGYHADCPPSSPHFSAVVSEALGREALGRGHPKEALHHFDHSLASHPSPSFLYLDRGFARFKLGEMTPALEDFRLHTAEISLPLSIPEFALGFAKGLPQGMYQSADGFLIFFSDLLTQPLYTAGQMWEALKILKDLVESGEWTGMLEAVAPEVYHLIKEWDSLPSHVRGEMAGKAVGKHGFDILLPGAVAKATVRGVKGAKELALASQAFKNAERTFTLETLARFKPGVNTAEVVAACEKVVILGEELGLSSSEMATLHKARKLEEKMYQAIDKLTLEQLDSVVIFKKAREYLKPFQGKYMPEMEVRKLIHETGIPTFPRPKGIPENYRVKLSGKGIGIKYVHPGNEQTYIRVMPGQPHSLNPRQQKPYVVRMKNGKTLDKLGNVLLENDLEAHILLEEFVFIGD